MCSPGLLTPCLGCTHSIIDTFGEIMSQRYRPQPMNSVNSVRRLCDGRRARTQQFRHKVCRDDGRVDGRRNDLSKSIVMGPAHSSMNTSKRSKPIRETIRNNFEINRQLNIACRSVYRNRAFGLPCQSIRHDIDQSAPVQDRERFVRAEPARLPARKNNTGNIGSSARVLSSQIQDAISAKVLRTSS